MEAKDTVMGDEATKQAVLDEWRVDFREPMPPAEVRNAIAKAQADISFKAGYNKALAQLADMTEECKQIGRKEVVETTLKIAALGGKVKVKELFELHPEGQAKLKEWGIDI